MKKFFRKTWFRIIACIVLYLIGLAIGISIIGFYPINTKQKTGNIKHSYTIGEEYIAGSDNEINKMKNVYRHILIFDKDGNCVRLESFDYDHTVSDFKDYLGSWVSYVSSGKEIFRITDSPFSPALLHFWMTSGVPVYDNGEYICSVFMIENIQNLPEAVLGFIIYYTLFFWICAYLIIITGRKRQKLDQIKQEYIANVTHALKTPNASIKSMAEALCDDVIDNPDKKKLYYGRILQEANAQNRMVSEILELSKLQTHQTDFTRQTVHASDFLPEIIDKYEILFDSTGITLHTSPDVFDFPPLQTNPSCVTQIFELLLDNAIKFVPEDGDVWIDAEVQRRKVIFSVKDNGIGISESNLPHIFERFYRCNKSDGSSNGSGLGLAIAKETAEGLGEKIWAESLLGQGTTFFFTISRK